MQHSKRNQRSPFVKVGRPHRGDGHNDLHSSSLKHFLALHCLYKQPWHQSAVAPRKVLYLPNGCTCSSNICLDGGLKRREVRSQRNHQHSSFGGIGLWFGHQRNFYGRRAKHAEVLDALFNCRRIEDCLRYYYRLSLPLESKSRQASIVRRKQRTCRYTAPRTAERKQMNDLSRLLMPLLHLSYPN